MNRQYSRFSLHESVRLGHLPGLFNPRLQKWLHLDLQPHGARGGALRALAVAGKLKKRKAQLPRELQSIVDRLATSSATASNQVSKLGEAQEAVAAAVSKHRDESHEGRAGH